MCGRFSLGVDIDGLIDEFGLADIPEGHAPRYNIAPTQPVLAVVRGPEGLRAGWLRWGLIPSAAPAPTGRPLINARSETIQRLPSFAASFRRRRCWILADGFYEWKRDAEGGRAAYHIRRPDGRPFALAGIWDRADGGNGPVVSCAILTTRSTPALAGIHDRMPVLLPPGDRDVWLDQESAPDALMDLLLPATEPLEVRPVGSRVNSVANDDPSCRTPLITGV